MTAQKVGVDMGFDDAFDAQAMLSRFVQIFVDVTAGVDHDCTAGALIPDQV